MNTVTANGLILIGWGVLSFLFYSLLSGPFDGRMCESTCFGMLYWGALVIAVLGTLLGLIQSFKPESGMFSRIALLSGLGLSAILTGIIVIGSMAT